MSAPGRAAAPSTTGRFAAVQSASERRPLVLVAIGTLLYSTGPVLVQASSVSGPVFSFWRLWIGVLGLALATVVHVRVTGRTPSRTGWRWAARAGVAFGLHQLLFMSALKATSVVDVTLMQTISPIIVAIVAVPLFGERPRPSFRLWSAVAILGALAVAVAGSSGPEGNPVGMAAAAGNVVFFAMYFVWSKQARDHIDVIPFLFGAALVAALTVTGFVLATGEHVTTASTDDLLLCALVALGPGALGHFISTWPLRWVPANIPPLMHLAIPALAGALAWVMLDESVPFGRVLAGAITLVGVGGAVMSPAGRELAAEAEAEAEAGVHAGDERHERAGPVP